MAYKWTPDLETGNALIDQQHQQLFTAINNLLDACAKGQGRAQIKSTMDFLSNYIVRHFSDEENLQRRYGYPDFANHKRYHETYKKTVAEIAAQLEKEGASVAMVSKVNTAIGGWLVNHIKKEDVKVAAHIRQREGR